MKPQSEIDAINCPRCRRSESIRYGFVKGRQRWLCHVCQYQFSVESLVCKPLGVKMEAAKRYEAGMSSNRVAKALGLSPTTVLLYSRLLGPPDGRVHDIPMRIPYPKEIRLALRLLRQLEREQKIKLKGLHP